jgi:hypothetical protein
VSKTCIEQRRDLMKLLGLAAATSVFPSGVKSAPLGREGMRIRKLSWAGILIETASSALFIDVVAPD